MIRLFTTAYNEKRPDRREEYIECLKRNTACLTLSELCIFKEGSSDIVPSSEKVKLSSVSERPLYNECFTWINRLVEPNDISIIANTDICFDESIGVLEAWDWPQNTCLALSRWDITLDGPPKLFEHGDCQDCWIFKGKISQVKGDFPFGVYDCDNKIAWELEKAGYKVVNPSLSIRTCHLHLCGYRSYEEKPAPDYGIRPPFKYVEPDNLFGPLTACYYYKKHNLEYFPWRMTWKKFRRYAVVSIMLRVWNKLLRTFWKRVVTKTC